LRKNAAQTAWHVIGSDSELCESLRTAQNTSRVQTLLIKLLSLSKIAIRAAIQHAGILKAQFKKKERKKYFWPRAPIGACSALGTYKPLVFVLTVTLNCGVSMISTTGDFLVASCVPASLFGEFLPPQHPPEAPELILFLFMESIDEI
jgi:hypothetical protein